MNNKLKGGIFVFLGACSFGVLSTIVKFAYTEGYVLGEIVGAQTLFGTIFLWIIYLGQLLLNKNNKATEIDKKDKPKTKTKWWKVCVAGSFTGLVGIFYYQCVQLIPASIAIILLMQYLWISILIEAVIFKKKPHKIQIIAAGIVLLGTLFAGGIFNDQISLNPKGIMFGFFAAISYALFLMTSGRIGNDLPVFKKSALMITGSLILTWFLFTPLFFIDGVLIGGLYKWGLALAFLGTVIPPLFFSIGIPKVGVSIGAILSAAELPTAVTCSYFILHESVDLLQWFGVIIILLAIVLTNIKFKAKDKSA